MDDRDKRAAAGASQSGSPRGRREWGWPARDPGPRPPLGFDHPGGPSGPRRHRSAEAVLKTLALYGFAGWAYIALNAVFHPYTLGWPLTHLVPWPHEDTFGAGCFALSLISFLALNLLRARAGED